MAGGAQTVRSSGGKIITQNAELLSLLIERTQSNMADNSPLEKIYVDSPAYEEDDDDKYRYVSTNVDDFDESQMSAFLMDKPPMDQLVESTDPNRYDEDEDVRQTPTGYAGTQRVKSNQFRLGDVEDEDEDLRREQEYQDGLLRRLAEQKQDDQKFLIPKLDLSDEEDNPRDSLDPTFGGFGKIHEISVRDSLDVDEEQQARDQERLHLLMEDADPQGFKVLIGDNLHKPSRDNTLLQSNPYKIDLNELRETPVPQHKPVSQPIPPGDDPRLKNMFQEQQQYPQQYAAPVHGPPSRHQNPNYEAPPADHYAASPHHPSHSSGHQPPPAPYQLQPPNSQILNSQNGQYEEEYRPTLQSQYLSLHPNGAGPSRVTTTTTQHWPQSLDSHTPQQFSQYQASQYDPSHHPGSRAAPQHYHGHHYHGQEDYQQQQQQQLYRHGHAPLPHSQEAYDNQPPPHLYQDQQYYNNQPQLYQTQPQVYQHQQQVYQNQPQIYQNQHAPQFEHPLQRAPQGFNPAIDQSTFRHPAPIQHSTDYNREFDEQSGASSPTLSEMQKSPKNKPKIDFLNRNKKDYTKAVPAAKNSYSKAYSDRKKVKENLPPGPALGGKRGPVRAQHPPQLKKENTSETFIVEDTKPGTAETMWSKRTQTLAHTRNNPGSGGKKGKRGPLKKYPSESRVDQMKTIHSAPSKLIPIKGSPRQAFTEPLRSEVVMDPNQDGGRPLRHTVYTDDGQRVSVDINLKLSPGAYAAPAPFYQGGYQPHLQMPPQQMPTPPSSIRSVGHYQPPIGPLPQENGYYYQQPPPQDNGYYYQPPLPQYQQQYQQYQQQEPEDYEQISHQQGQSVVDRSTPLSQRSGRAPSPVGSPFKVLPPIGSADSNRRDTARQEGSQPGTGRKPKKLRPPPPPKEDVLPPKDNTSYLEAMRRVKERKPVEFRQYTVEDYKKLKREVRLGGLGPDLDSNVLKERREKRERQVEYAKHINMKNKKDLENAPRVAPKPTPEELDAENDLLHRRRVALEYAKSVPKPKTRPQGERKDPGMVGPTPAPKMTTTTIRPSNNKPPVSDPDMLDLDTLRRRHEEEKQQAALIRQQVQAANT